MGFNTEDTSTWFVCDIGQTDYDCTFAIEVEEQIKVFKIEIATDIRTELFLDVDFTLSQVGYDFEPPLNTVVTITLLVALSDEYKLYAYSNKDYKIALPFHTGDPPTTVEVEQALLRIERQVQQINTKVLKTISIDEFLDIDGIVIETWEANQFLKVNGTATAIVCSPTTIDFSTLDEETPALVDWIVFGDSSDSDNEKKARINALNSILLHADLVDTHSVLGFSPEVNGGLAGGGDLSAERFFKMDIEGNTLEKINPVVADLLIIADSEDSNKSKKVSVNNLLDLADEDIDFAGIPDDVIVGADYIIFGDSSAALATKKDTLDDINTILTHTDLSGSHSTSGYSTNVNVGLTGGGDLSTGRDLTLDVNNLVVKAVPTINDYLPLEDVAASSITKKVTVNSIVSLASGTFDFNVVPTTSVAVVDYVLFGDSSDSLNSKKDTFTNLNSVLDHDNLLNYVANEHIDHSGVNANTNANSGLAGGGDLTTSRDIELDVNNLTTKAAPIEADYLALQDSEAADVTKKATLTSVVSLVSSSFDFNSVATDSVVLADYALFGDSSDSLNSKRDTFTNLNSVLDHDNLLNYVANEHIDHSGVNANTNANSGLAGGGDLTTSRDLELDVNNLSQKLIPTVNDFIPIQDVADSDNMKRSTVGNIVSLASGSFDFDAVPSDNVVLADYVLFGDISDSNLSKKDTFTDLNAVLDHDNLLNYDTNEHIDHTAISVQAFTNKGLASTNSDLTADVEFGLDSSNLQSKGSIVDADTVQIYDSANFDNPKKISYSNFKVSIYEIVGAKNYIINPCGCVARRSIHTFSTVVQDSGIIKGETERFGGRAYSASANIGAGSFRQGSNAITSVPQKSHRFFTMTLTGVGSFTEIYYRMPDEDARRFYNEIASFSVNVAHNVGSAVPYKFFINKADALNNFTTTTNIATSGDISVTDGGTAQVIKFENISMGDCRNGIEIIVRVTCDTVVTKTFEHSEFQMNLGPNVSPYIYNVSFAEMLSDCSRYYHKSYDYATKVGTITQIGAIFVGALTASLLMKGTCNYFRNFVFNPTITIYSSDTGVSGKIRDLQNTVDRDGTITQIGQTGFYVGIVSATIGGMHAFHFRADGELY